MFRVMKKMAIPLTIKIKMFYNPKVFVPIEFIDGTIHEFEAHEQNFSLALAEITNGSMERVLDLLGI